ncbi:MAG: hypothetical protein SP1CHLAM54_13250 [Chlamydiia bacterium]|nr:hypothetical protein [Chlamydiia bacterium]MCH9616221.1 hypothetical protein [Chlamydiia bacterium]MCH9629793.1 hypothetical protein [Chlamydiia bacterium]
MISATSFQTFDQSVRAHLHLGPQEDLEEGVDNVYNFFRTVSVLGVYGGSVLTLAGIVTIGSLTGVVLATTGLSLYFFGQFSRAMVRPTQVLLDAVRVAVHVPPDRFTEILSNYTEVFSVALEAARVEAYLPLLPRYREVSEGLIEWYQRSGRNLSYRDAAAQIRHRMSPPPPLLQAGGSTMVVNGVSRLWNWVTT